MKYRLLKDLGKWLEGTLFEGEPNQPIRITTKVDGVQRFINTELGSGEYFEPVFDEPIRWRADHGKTYHCVDNNMTPDWNRDDRLDDDDDAYKIGNYFRTRAEAQAVSSAIKAILEYVHTPIEETIPVDKSNYIRLVDQARKELAA